MPKIGAVNKYDWLVVTLSSKKFDFVKAKESLLAERNAPR